MTAATDSVEELRRMVEQLQVEVQEIKQSRSGQGRRTNASPSIDARVSRAGLLRVAGVGAIAAASAGLQLQTSTGTATAADGASVKLGFESLAENPTSVRYDGSAGLNGFVLLGNDSTNSPSLAFFPAACGGVAGAGNTAGAGGVANGVHGYTDNGDGNGVVGYNSNFVAGAGTGVLGQAMTASGFGVKGTNTKGTGVYGGSDSIASGATAIEGELTSTSPGGNSSAVRGKNNGAGSFGIGVWGSQNGGGWGGYFTSVSGIGVNTSGGSGTGVSASGSIGVSASGTKIGVSASGVMAIYGGSKGTFPSAIAIEGEIISPAPGVLSSAVRGKNNGTHSSGIGVYGSHNGAGWGGYFTSVSGIGLNVSGGSGTGVSASGSIGVLASGSTTGVSATGNTIGVNAVGPTAVQGTGSQTGVSGISTSGTGMRASGSTGISATGVKIGVAGTSVSGRGGVFKGKAASVRLVPSGAGTHPTSGNAGDVFVDAKKRIWFCTKGGGVATWKQVQLQ